MAKQNSVCTVAPTLFHGITSDGAKYEPSLFTSSDALHITTDTIDH